MPAGYSSRKAGVAAPALALRGGEQPGELLGARARGPADAGAHRTGRGRVIRMPERQDVNLQVAIIMAASLLFLVAVRRGFRPLLAR